MNHPRRLLFLVPAALLGAALLVRARLPRPQTEGDKWLWELGERATKVYILFVDTDPHVTWADGGHWTYIPFQIGDRQGIREVYRSLEGTLAFTPVKGGKKPDILLIWNRNRIVAYMNAMPGKEKLCLYSEGQHYFLYRGRDGFIAPVSRRSVTLLRATMKESVAKARSHQSGYILGGSVLSLPST